MNKHSVLASILSDLGVQEATTTQRPLQIDIDKRGDFGDQAARTETILESRWVNQKAKALGEEIRILETVDLSPAQTVRVGALVCVENSEGNSQIFFILPLLCSPKVQNVTVITPKSPIGAALMEKRPGEMATANTPRGTRMMKVVSVE